MNSFLLFATFIHLSFGGAITGLSSLKWIKDKGCDYTITSQNLNASFIISALFPIQQYSPEDKEYKFNPYAISWTESFLYAIDVINKNEDILPNVRLGYDVRNTCDNEQVAIKHTLDFMLDKKYMVRQPNKNKDNEITPFWNKTSQQCSCPVLDISSNMIGVVGGARSMVSASVSHLLSTKNIPQISYASTSPLLSDKDLYKNFLRTVPSDLKQIEAIVDFLQRLNFTYISTLAEDDDHGRLALDSFKIKIKAAGMCLAIDKLFDSTLPHELNKTIDALQREYDKSQVVVLWCSVNKAKDIIKNAAKLKNLFWIIGTETLGASEELKRINEDIKVITLSVAEHIVPSFINHTQYLQFTSPVGNTLLSLMWESYGYCPDQNRSDCINRQPNRNSLPTLRHENIMTTAYAFARGLHHMLGCEQDPIGCYQNINGSFDHKELLRSLYRTNNSFRLPETDFLVNFDSKGDFDVNTYEYLFVRGNYMENIKIGEWKGKKKTITTMNETLLWSYFNDNNGTIIKPAATCAYPCQPGTYKLANLKSCCWECISCSQYTISSVINAHTCTSCPLKETPNKNLNRCIPLTDKNLKLMPKIAIPILAVSAFGILLTCIFMACFIKSWNTPLVKSSSREMSIVQFLSMIILFSMPVLHMLPLTTYLCVLQTVLFGTFHTLIIAFIFIKTYRLYKVFQPARFTRISKYLHNRYQILPSIALVLIQIAVLTIWYSLHLPTVKLHVDASGYVYSCDYHERFLLYAVVGYIIIMSLITGYMGFRARNLPSSFNDAQYIWLGMFTFCLAWMCFYPLHLSSPQWRRPIIFLAVNMVSTFTLLIILYGYKIRIILLYPHLNTQAHFSKLAENATIKTFLKEVDPSRRQSNEPLHQSVISFDFDGMFDEYKKIKHKKSSIRENLHFPTVKDIRKSFRKRRKESTKKQQRRRTLELNKYKDNKDGKKLPDKNISFDDPSTTTLDVSIESLVIPERVEISATSIVTKL